MEKILVLQKNTMAEYLYKDLIDDEGTYTFYVGDDDVSPFIYSFRAVHTSIKATKFMEPPFKSIWYYKRLKKSGIQNEKKCYIFQVDTAIKVGIRTIEELRRDGHRVILIILDSIEAHSWTMLYAKRYIFQVNWDMILSFDKKDCEKYGFEYLGFSYYSKLELNNEAIETDLFYAGRIKNESSRIDILKRIYKCALADRIKVKFIISGLTNPILGTRDILEIKDNISYDKILHDVKKTKCILEIIQPGQSNQTVRYMEAICYNKKLLTNNEGVKSMPFYNEKYIHVFRSPEEIDYDWLIEDCEVSYGYNNEFSPLNLYRIIDS